MANHGSTAGLKQLRTLFAAGTATGLSDAELLDRITTGTRTANADEAAFETLIARHGPMVLGVCRRALTDPRDVEDAFQATFLVLVRKSSAVRVDDSLGRWLYGVARRVAHRARTIAERRRARETSFNPAVWEPATSSGLDVDRAELLAALDDELGRLPEKYRTAVLLCDLEGLSHGEAARRLQWPVGTVKGRLAQGRTLLKGRLTRRGLAPSAVFLLGTVIPSEARAVVPAALVAKTVRSALNFAIGGKTGATLASATVVALTRGALRTMFWTKLKVVAIGLLAAFEIAAGAVVLAQAGRDDGAETSGLEIEASPSADHPANGASKPRPANAVAIVSDVESETTLIALAPNGSEVSRGDLVCRLDATELKAELTRQVIATANAEAAFENAKHAREIAEIALTEYVEGIYKQEQEAIQGEINLAVAERKRAEDRLGWSNRMRAKGYVSNDQNLADKISLERKIFSQEQAETKKRVLERYTYRKTVKELQSEVEKARANERIKKHTWKQLKETRAKIENQIEHCRIVAPVSGRLDYARWPVPGAGEQFATVERGMTVRWAQLLFWVIPAHRDVDRTR